MDPQGEAALYGISLNQGLAAGTISSTPKQVLAFNPKLNDAADAHSNWMLDADAFSHTGVGGSSPGQRMTTAGYQFTGSWTWGENIAWSGSTGSYSGDLYAATHHKNLFLSAGHRTNILNDNFREIGIGSISGSFKSGSTTYNALMTTENFAKSGSNVFVTGVTYNDTDNNDFYSIGEGRGSRTITLFQNGSSVVSSTSSAAGGYSLGTTATGPIEVRFSGGGLALTMGVAVTLASSNVKVDLVDGNNILSNVSAQLTQSSVNLTLLGIENVNGSGNGLANTITGNKGNNTLSGEDGNDTLIGGAGVDIYLGGLGDDIVHAESSDNLLQSFGGGGSDKIYITGSAPSGFDYAANGFEELWVNGVLIASTGTGGGDTGGGDEEPPTGTEGATEGDDNLIGTAGNDTIKGLGGNDVINGAAGADTMSGGHGHDTYIVDNTGDSVNETGGSGTDTVLSSITFSLADTSKATGSIENLTLTGTAAINATGNHLANIIVGNAASNVMSGGTGVDTVSYEAAAASVKVSLALTSSQSTGGAGNDTLSGFENLTGSAHFDTLTGSSGNNTILGLAGNDTISGGLGSDVLVGGQGNDLLTGGSSGDRFVFTSLTDGADVVTDFSSRSDKLDFTELAASVGLGDASYATLVANGNIVITTGNYATGNASNGSSTDTRIFFDSDGTGGAAATLIVTLEDVKITSSDFLV